MKGKDMKRIIMVLALLASTSVVLAGPAQATEGGHSTEPCTQQVIDKEAYDETVTTSEAYDEQVIDTPAQPAVAGKWWNFSPNKDQGKLESAPAFPSDPRGTWQGPHTNGGPDGEGTYQVGKGKASWFHREAGTPAVDATYKTVHHDAVTEVVHHDATYKTVEVPCEEEPPTFTPYETTICWQMDNSDGIEGTYEWPQTRADCNTQPACDEVIEFQIDTYWIRDADDEAYLAGLTHLNGPEDDASLEPHNYSSKLVRGDECEQPPVVTTKTQTQERQVVGEPDCEAGYAIVSYQERTRTITITDGVKEKGPWSEWVQVDNGTIPVTEDQCPVVVPPVDVCPDIPENQPEGTDCNPVTPPVEPPVTPPVVTPPVVSPPADNPTPVVATTPVTEDEVLPATGAPTSWLLIYGGILAASGVGLISIGRRKRFNK